MQCLQTSAHEVSILCGVRTSILTHSYGLCMTEVHTPQLISFSCHPCPLPDWMHFELLWPVGRPACRNCKRLADCGQAGLRECTVGNLNSITKAGVSRDLAVPLYVNHFFVSAELPAVITISKIDTITAAGTLRDYYCTFLRDYYCTFQCLFVALNLPS